MAKYMAPEGYNFDPQTGLYVKDLLVTDTEGVNYRHRISFNDETGEYTQQSVALMGNTATAPVMAAKGKTRKRGLIVAAVLSLLAVVCVVAFVVSYKNRGYDAPYVFSDEELGEICEEYAMDTIPDSVLDLKEYDGVVYEGGIIR